jgi:hypothetical protein
MGPVVPAPLCGPWSFLELRAVLGGRWPAFLLTDRDLQTALRENATIRSENAELRQGLKAAMDILQPLIAKPELPGQLCVQRQWGCMRRGRNGLGCS